MRKLYFLFPELTIKQGGHTAQMAFLEMSKRFCSAEAVTYRQKTPGVKNLDELLRGDQEKLKQGIFVIHWGPHVPKLVKRLKGMSVVYVAHSTGWGFDLPINVPVLAVSRHTQSYWATKAPKNPVFYLPNILPDHFYTSDKHREVDVLVMKRKISSYVMSELLPLLQASCHVKVLDGWLDNLADEMRASKIFLYDSSEHWRDQGVSEGFGLPPLEAMASGCKIFSSLNHALSDYLEPDVNCHQLGIFSAQYDASRILNQLDQWKPHDSVDNVVHNYRSDKVAEKMRTILPAINEFFNQSGSAPQKKAFLASGFVTRLEMLTALFT